MADRILKCPGCVFLTVSASRFSEHMIKGHIESSGAMFLCPGCPNTFLSPKSLQIHLEVDHHVDPEEIIDILSLITQIPLNAAPANNGISIKSLNMLTSSSGEAQSSPEPPSMTEGALLGICDKILKTLTEIKEQQNNNLQMDQFLQMMNQFQAQNSLPTNDTVVQEEIIEETIEDLPEDKVFVKDPEDQESEMEAQEEPLEVVVPEVKTELSSGNETESVVDSICVVRPMPFMCKECRKSFHSYTSLLRHIKMGCNFKWCRKCQVRTRKNVFHYCAPTPTPAITTISRSQDIDSS